MGNEHEFISECAGAVKMGEKTSDVLRSRLSEENFQKLVQLNNPALYQFIAKYVELCNPDDTLVCTGSPEDIRHIKEQAIASGEEKKLATKGHTIHFDGYYDQARDRKNT